MNESNPQNKDSQQNNIESEFKKTYFNELIETLYEDETPENKEMKKEKIEESLKKKELRFPHISHLYLEISRKAAILLVKHIGQRKVLEKGYSNLLELISETLKLTPDFPKKDDGEIDEDKREKETLHLWKNRDLLNDAMSHYVREIQRLREIKHKRWTIRLSILAIIISAIALLVSLFF